MMDKSSLIYVAGGHTLIGRALIRQLLSQGYSRTVTDDTLDYTDAVAVDQFFARIRPEYVFLAAGKSGGILSNQRHPAELIRDNLLSECHLIHAAWCHGVTKLLYLASSCSYPRQCSQPMRVESLMTGPLEPTNEAYAMAKLTGLALVRAYRTQYQFNAVSVIPANAFGPGDDFHPDHAHVIGALIRRMHEARLERLPTVTIWGTGLARRDFVFADDLADACLFVMRTYEDDAPLNVGSGFDWSIRELASEIQEIVGYRGQLVFDEERPDGMPLKSLDSSPLLNMGWKSTTPFRHALEQTYRWFFLTNRKQAA